MNNAPTLKNFPKRCIVCGKTCRQSFWMRSHFVPYPMRMTLFHGVMRNKPERFMRVFLIITSEYLQNTAMTAPPWTYAN